MTRQTQFSRSLQGTAQDLQRVQQIIAGLTDTIRGVTREFSALLTGVNQAAGGAPTTTASSVAGSFLTPRGDQLGRELLGSAQQRLMDDISKYNQQSVDRQRKDAEAMRAAQSLRVAESNAVRAGVARPDLTLVEQMHEPGALIRGRFARASAVGGMDASAIGFAAQQRLKEGMSVPEVSLLLQQSLNKEQLEAFRSHGGKYGELGRKMAGVQTMVGMPAERIQSRIAADLAKTTERAEFTARQQAVDASEKQRSDAHRFLSGGYSSNDRTHSIALAQATGDRGLLYSLGDVRRSAGTSIRESIEDATKQAERLKVSASGVDRATSIEIEKVVEELKLLRQSTEKSDKRLHDVIISGARPGDSKYDKAIEELKRVTDKQSQAAERLKDLTKGGDGDGPRGPDGWMARSKTLVKGIVDTMAAMAPVVSAGFGMSQGMLQSNIGANRRSINAEADLAQMKFQRFMESSDMTKAENLVKYRANFLLPKMEARDLKYMGSEARDKAMSEAQRETLQNLELSQRAAFGSKVSAGFNATLGVAAGVTSGLTPMGAIGVTQGIAGTMGAINNLENNQFQQLTQGGLIGGPAGVLSGLSGRRQELQARENIRAATAAIRSETYRNFNELQNAELRSNPALLYGVESYYRGIEAKLRGGQYVGASRSVTGFEEITGDKSFKKAVSDFKAQSDRTEGRLNTDNDLINIRTNALIEAFERGTYTTEFGMGNMLTREQAEDLDKFVPSYKSGFGVKRLVLDTIKKSFNAQMSSAEDLASAQYSNDTNLLTQGYSGKTSASVRGLTPEEFADLSNRSGTAMGPGARRGFGRIAGRTFDISSAGLGSFDTLLGQMATLNRVTGSSDSSKSLESILTHAVSAGFDNSRLAPQFVNTVTGLAESIKSTTTEGIAGRLRGASDFLSVNGVANERSFGLAAAGMSQWNDFTSQRGGVLGQMKTAALLKAGIGFGTGLSTISSLSEEAALGWQNQIKTGNVTDETLKDLLNVHGKEKLQNALSTVSKQGSVLTRGLTAYYSGDQTDKLKMALSATGKEREKLMSELRIAYKDVGTDTFGPEGGLMALYRDLERASEETGISMPVSIKKSFDKYLGANKTRDPAAVEREIERTKQARGTLGRTAASATAESVRSRLEKEGEFNIGAMTLTKEMFEKYERGDLGKSETAAIKNWMNSPGIERERSASETKGRDYVKGAQAEVDPNTVNKRTTEVIGEFSTSVEKFKTSIQGFEKSVSDATLIIRGHLSKIKAQGG